MKTILAALTALVAATGLSATAGVGPAAARTASADTAFLRGAHLSPDTPSVDVYLTAFRGGTTSLWLSKVGYGDVSPYRRIAAGQYAVSMRPHGASRSSKPALSWSIDLQPGQSYTAYAIGMNAALRGTIVRDSLATPGAGSGRVRVVQASSRAGRVDVSAGSSALAHDVPFGRLTGYQDVQSGTWTVHVDSLTHTALTASTQLDVASRSVTSIVVLDSKGSGVQVRTLVDAAGPASAPVGAVPAGGGGMARTFARPSTGVDWTLLAGGALAALSALGLLALGATRRRVAVPR